MKFLNLFISLMLLSFSTISFAVSRSTERAWLRCTQNHCGSYAGPGGPCYDGPGGALYSGPGGACYAGPGGPLYSGPGGPLYNGPGGACYAGPGGPCYNGPGGDGENCSWACQ